MKKVLERDVETARNILADSFADEILGRGLEVDATQRGDYIDNAKMEPFITVCSGAIYDSYDPRIGDQTYNSIGEARAAYSNTLRAFLDARDKSELYIREFPTLIEGPSGWFIFSRLH